MSHAEQRGFFAAVAEANRHLVAGAKVLEIGSYDVNGTVRALFSSAGAYTGVDLDHGRHSFHPILRCGSSPGLTPRRVSS